MNTSLHINSFNKNFNGLFMSILLYFPLGCILFGFAPSWQLVILGFVNYLILVYSEKLVMFFFKRLSLSMSSISPVETFKSLGPWGCMIWFSNIAGSVLFVWFSWYSTLSIILIRWLVLFGIGYRNKRFSDRELLQTEARNPLNSNGKWIIAVSRRFNLKEVDDLYYKEVLPILREYGTVLECLYAENSPESTDFWMTRMGLILEIADIHVLMEHFPSVAILHEQEYSDSLLSNTRGILLTDILLGKHLDEATSGPLLKHNILRGHLDKASEIERFVPFPATIRLNPSFIETLITGKLHLALNGKNRRFSAAFRNELDKLSKFKNVFYAEMALGIFVSIYGSLQNREQLAALMQVEETAREITNTLLKKIQDLDDPILKNNKNILLVQNKYNQFLLQIRAKEKVIPRNYSESYTLIKDLVLGVPDGTDFSFSDIDSRPLYKAIYRFGSITFHLYVIWLRILNRDSIR